MLSELMKLKKSIAIAGTHGKTTTTSLISKILDTNKMDPTIINGGIISSLASNAKLGQGHWMVVEADESDGSFNKLPVTIGIVTNIDKEHLDYYGNFPNLKRAFERFISRSQTARRVNVRCPNWIILWMAKWTYSNCRNSMGLSCI